MLFFLSLTKYISKHNNLFKAVLLFFAMRKKSKREMVAFHNSGLYTLLVNRIVSSTERVKCELRDEETKEILHKKVDLCWGGLGDGATVNTIPRGAYWEKASKIEIVVGPSAYEIFYEKGKVCARHSTGNVLVEIVDNLEDYL